MAPRAVVSDEATRVTEAVNPRTQDLDLLGSDDLVDRLLAEDASVAGAVARTRPELVRATELLVRTLQAGGRWLNLGAGTSGRLGVLDASEIPPTFGLPPDRVQGVIAGGPPALERAVEGAEDAEDGAVADLEERGFSAQDALVTLSASGRTPYTHAALLHARRLGAGTIAITCAPGSPLARDADVAIVAEVGPEAIAGSTRLKGGLAQKMILHTLSTAVMVRLGRTCGNRMSHLAISNAKLRARAIELLVELTGCSPDTATRALAAADDSVRDALARLRGQAVPRDELG